MVKWEREDKMIKNSYKGKFIVFEGIDGCGKSTQVQLLAKYLKKQEKKVLVTDEPTKGPIGRLIRQALAGKISLNNFGLQLLFCADRDHHLKNLVIPYLKKGYIIISDRYAFSTLAYGGIDNKMEDLIKINQNFLLPDITFILKIRPEIGLARVKSSRRNLEIFEKMRSLKKIAQNYQKISRRFSHVYLINGEKPILEVFEEVKKIIDKILKL